MTEMIRSTPSLDTLRAHRDAILRVAERYGAYNVRVFGSVARGDAQPGSDVDLLVNFQTWASLYDVSGLKQDLEELLGCGVDVVSDHPRLKERLRKRILRDAVAL
jgi:hypothetical protein